jgi:hypothetical protein
MIASETLSTFWHIETPDVEKIETIDIDIELSIAIKK